VLQNITTRRIVGNKRAEEEKEDEEEKSPCVCVTKDRSRKKKKKKKKYRNKSAEEPANDMFLSPLCVRSFVLRLLIDSTRV